MNTHDTRLDRLERRRTPPRRAHTFIPLGIAHTAAEVEWLAVERDRLGLGERDDLLAFSWLKGDVA